jgi:purine-binding chemotaxis protein CheW
VSTFADAEVIAKNALLTFELDGQLYAAPLTHVSEVIRDHTVTPVPGAADDLLGICQLRGSIVPVMDGRRRLGLRAATDTNEDSVRIVVFSQDAGRVGLKVDAVGDLVRPTADLITSPPARLRAVRGDDPVQAVFAWGSDFVALLDVPRLIRLQSGTTSVV